jgi:hypothetical protein
MFLAIFANALQQIESIIIPEYARFHNTICRKTYCSYPLDAHIALIASFTTIQERNGIKLRGF